MSISLQLRTPHIPLRSSLAEALVLLDSLGYPIVMDDDRSLRVDTPEFNVAIYPHEGHVKSTWYDDPLGRTSDEGIEAKINLYLTRYGALAHWELRLDNGWMRYWYNPTYGVSMVYGIHNDVIRFNEYQSTD